MCLYTNKEAVKKFLKDNKKVEFIYCYKRVQLGKLVWNGYTYVTNSSGLYGPYQSCYQYKAGWNKSNSKRRKPYTTNHSVGKGIHVYLTKRQAKSYTYGSELIIRVKCYLKDFLGINGRNTHAVFSKVYINPVTYKKALES